MARLECDLRIARIVQTAGGLDGESSGSVAFVQEAAERARLLPDALKSADLCPQTRVRNQLLRPGPESMAVCSARI